MRSLRRYFNHPEIHCKWVVLMTSLTIMAIWCVVVMSMDKSVNPTWLLETKFSWLGIGLYINAIVGLVTWGKMFLDCLAILIGYQEDIPKLIWDYVLSSTAKTIILRTTAECEDLLES